MNFFRRNTNTNIRLFNSVRKLTLNQKFLWVPGSFCDETLYAPVFENLAPEIQENSIFVSWKGCTCSEDFSNKINDAINAEHPEQPIAVHCFSMGAHVFQEAYLQHDYRNINSVVFISPAAQEYTEKEIKVREQIAIKFNQNPDRWFVSLKPRSLGLVYKEHPEKSKITDLIYTMAKSFTNSEINAQQYYLLKRHNIFPQFAEKINAAGTPVFILHGRQDPLNSSDAIKKAAELISDAVLEFIDKCGHMSLIENPQAIAKSTNEHYFSLSLKTQASPTRLALG